MYQSVLSDRKFPVALLALDEQMAEEAQERGCLRCGGQLHSARYPRKPRGGPWALGPEQDVRLSFCCEREGCRRRMTPPSVRFLGRRVYLGVVVLLATVLQQGASGRRASRLCTEVGISRRTLVRWRRWWTEQVPKARWFASVRAHIVPEPLATEMPSSLLDRMVGAACERVVSVLRWLIEPEHAF